MGYGRRGSSREAGSTGVGSVGRQGLWAGGVHGEAGLHGAESVGRWGRWYVGRRGLWDAGYKGGGVYRVGSVGRCLRGGGVYINVASVGRRGLWEAESMRRRGS